MCVPRVHTYLSVLEAAVGQISNWNGILLFLKVINQKWNEQLCAQKLQKGDTHVEFLQTDFSVSVLPILSVLWWCCTCRWLNLLPRCRAVEEQHGCGIMFPPDRYSANLTLILPQSSKTDSKLLSFLNFLDSIGYYGDKRGYMEDDRWDRTCQMRRSTTSKQ